MRTTVRIQPLGAHPVCRLGRPLSLVQRKKHIPSLRAPHSSARSFWLDQKRASQVQLQSCLTERGTITCKATLQTPAVENEVHLLKDSCLWSELAHSIR